MARTLDLTLATRPSEIARLVDRLEGFGMTSALPPDVAFRLMLALDETVSNVHDDVAHVTPRLRVSRHE